MALSSVDGIEDTTISKEAWLNHQQVIYDLYIVQRLPLKTIRQHLWEVYSFRASKPQYKRRLKDWGYSKNLKASTCKAIGRSLDRRKLSGKNAVAVVRGATLSSQQLQGALRRHHLPSLKQKLGLEPQPPTPEGVLVQKAFVNPSALSSDHLPGTFFLSQAQSLCAALRADPFPGRLEASDIASHAGHPLSSLGLPRSTESLDENTPFHNTIEDFCIADTRMQKKKVTEPHTQGSNHLGFDARSTLLSYTKNGPLSDHSQEADATGLLNYFPLQKPDDVLQNVKTLIHKAGRVDHFVLISYVIYLCANSHLSGVFFDRFAYYLLNDGNRFLLKHLSQMDSLYIRDLEDRLLLYAAQKNCYDLLDVLSFRQVRRSRSELRITSLMQKMLRKALGNRNEVFCWKLLEEWTAANQDRTIGIACILDQETLALAARHLPTIFAFLLARMSMSHKAEMLPLVAQDAMSTVNINLLLDEGMNVNTVDIDGWTALHYAILSEDIPLIQRLLKSGASTEAFRSSTLPTSRNICPPLHLAAEVSNMDLRVCELLLNAGADVNSSAYRTHPEK